MRRLGKLALGLLCAACAVAGVECVGQVVYWHRNDKWLFTSHLGAYESLFTKHPYLIAAPVPNTRFVSPRGAVFSHNAQGFRGRPLTTEKGSGTKRILAFGGSTTYCAGLSDDETWPELLQQDLGPGYEVANLGVPGYSTAENIIQTALNISDLTPDVCLYYIGWNDMRSVHVRDLRSDYSDFHAPTQYYNLKLHHFKRGQRLMLVFWLDQLWRRLFYKDVDVALSLSPGDGARSAEPDPRALGIYARNVRSLIHLCRAQGARPVMVPQVLNYDRLRSDTSYVWSPYLRDKDTQVVMAQYNEVLRDVSAAERADFVDSVLQQPWNSTHFWDRGHLNRRGSEMMARTLGAHVREKLR